MLGGDIGAGMYRKAMSMPIPADEGCNYCRRDGWAGRIRRKSDAFLLFVRGERVGFSLGGWRSVTPVILHRSTNAAMLKAETFYKDGDESCFGEEAPHSYCRR